MDSKMAFARIDGEKVSRVRSMWKAKEDERMAMEYSQQEAEEIRSRNLNRAKSSKIDARVVAELKKEGGPQDYQEYVRQKREVESKDEQLSKFIVEEEKKQIEDKKRIQSAMDEQVAHRHVEIELEEKKRVAEQKRLQSDMDAQVAQRQLELELAEKKFHEEQKRLQSERDALLAKIQSEQDQHEAQRLEAARRKQADDDAALAHQADFMDKRAATLARARTVRDQALAKAVQLKDMDGSSSTPDLDAMIALKLQEEELLTKGLNPPQSTTTTTRQRATISPITTTATNNNNNARVLPPSVTVIPPSSSYMTSSVSSGSMQQEIGRPFSDTSSASVSVSRGKSPSQMSSRPASSSVKSPNEHDVAAVSFNSEEFDHFESSVLPVNTNIVAGTPRRSKPSDPPALKAEDIPEAIAEEPEIDEASLIDGLEFESEREKQEYLSFQRAQIQALRRFEQQKKDEELARQFAMEASQTE